MSGRDARRDEGRGALQALLFAAAFWCHDVSRFVHERPRRLPAPWPWREDYGALSWRLSTVGGDWHDAETLATLRAVRDGNTVKAKRTGSAFAVRVLRPLLWFGLVEFSDPEGQREVRRWPKTALFDRLLSFDVGLAEDSP